MDVHQDINNTKNDRSLGLPYEVQQFFNQFVQLQVKKKNI